MTLPHIKASPPMTPPIIGPRVLLLLFEVCFSVELATVDAEDEVPAASLVALTVGDDGVELAVADRVDDVELVSTATEEDGEVLVVEDVGVAKN